jgi:hypothetical protein
VPTGLWWRAASSWPPRSSRCASPQRWICAELKPGAQLERPRATSRPRGPAGLGAQRELGGIAKRLSIQFDTQTFVADRRYEEVCTLDLDPASAVGRDRIGHQPHHTLDELMLNIPRCGPASPEGELQDRVTGPRETP